MGALEQHGNQAPLGTDDIIAGAMVEYLGRALEEAGEGDFPILAFPVIPVGLSTEHKNFCGSRDPEAGHLLPSAVTVEPLRPCVPRGKRAGHPGAEPGAAQRSGTVSLHPVPPARSGHPDVRATVSEGNVYDFHGGEMETSMVMAVDPSLVRLETAEAGIPQRVRGQPDAQNCRAASPSGGCRKNWKTADGKPIGIGGDPSGATAEKGRIILETSARELVPGTFGDPEMEGVGDTVISKT